MCQSGHTRRCGNQDKKDQLHFLWNSLKYLGFLYFWVPFFFSRNTYKPHTINHSLGSFAPSSRWNYIPETWPLCFLVLVNLDGILLVFDYLGQEEWKYPNFCIGCFNWQWFWKKWETETVEATHGKSLSRAFVWTYLCMQVMVSKNKKRNQNHIW